MPYLKLTTNQTINPEVTSPLLCELSQLIAKETGKPERYVMIELDKNETMLFAGGNQPLAFVVCKSIGLSSQQSKSLAKSICRLLENSLQIQPERVYIEFSNCPAEFWGWNSSTFG